MVYIYIYIWSCRGYYRCSTSKGCSAKKQVERCRTDASVLIITYTSTHNHPAPDNLTPQIEESHNQPTESLDLSVSSKEKEDKHNHEPNSASDKLANEENFYYLQSPIQCSEDIIIDQDYPFEKSHDRIDLLLEKEPFCYSQYKNLSAPKSEEHDFFDELEELPISSPFLNSMRTKFSEERIAVAPSWFKWYLGACCLEECKLEMFICIIHISVTLTIGNFLFHPSFQFFVFNLIMLVGRHNPGSLEINAFGRWKKTIFLSLSPKHARLVWVVKVWK